MSTADNAGALPQGVRITARGTQAAEVLIYGTIGESWFFEESVTASDFRKELKALGSVKELVIRVNSDGGSVPDGLAIYNSLKAHPARKVVHVDGHAASIASVIAMAGDTIEMGEGTQMMIHDASTIAWGNAGELRRTAELLDSISGDIAEIYARRSGKPAETIRNLMTAETWFKAREAVDFGLADTTLAGDPAVQAHLEPAEAARFKHPPKALLSVRAQHSASRVASMAARAARYASAGA